jgi:hypothetical protein
MRIKEDVFEAEQATELISLEGSHQIALVGNNLALDSVCWL